MTTTESVTGVLEKPANVPLKQLPRTLVNRRWWWATLLVIVLSAIFIRLGFWQLDRLDQRQARNAEYLAQISAAPLTLTGESLPADPPGLRDRLAQVQGRYDFDQQIILVQQSYEGRPGAHLVTPLRIAGSDTAVLIDRGWIPAAEASADTLGAFDQPGELTVSGVVQLSQTLSGDRQTVTEGPQLEWYRVDIEAIQKQLPYPILPLYLLASPPDGFQEQLPYRIAPEIDLSDGPHLGYAIQWFLFAAVLTFGYLRFVTTQTNRLSPKARK